MSQARDLTIMILCSNNDTMLQNQATTIRNLEVQMGQIHNMLAGQTQGALPNNTEKNPKEQMQAINLRSGKQLE